MTRTIVDRWEATYSAFFARRWDARATYWRRAAARAREAGLHDSAATAELKARAASRRALSNRQRAR